MKHKLSIKRLHFYSFLHLINNHVDVSTIPLPQKASSRNNNNNCTKKRYNLTKMNNPIISDFILLNNTPTLISTNHNFSWPSEYNIRVNWEKKKLSINLETCKTSNICHKFWHLKYQILWNVGSFRMHSR